MSQRASAAASGRRRVRRDDLQGRLAGCPSRPAALAADRLAGEPPHRGARQARARAGPEAARDHRHADRLAPRVRASDRRVGLRARPRRPAGPKRPVSRRRRCCGSASTRFGSPSSATSRPSSRPRCGPGSRKTCSSSRAASARRTTTARSRCWRGPRAARSRSTQELASGIETLSRRVAERLNRPVCRLRRRGAQAGRSAGRGAVGRARRHRAGRRPRHGRVRGRRASRARRVSCRSCGRGCSRRGRCSICAGARQAPGRRVLRLFGVSESAVAQALAAAGGDGDGVAVTICARDFEIHVDLFVEAGAEARGDRARGGARRGERALSLLPRRAARPRSSCSTCCAPRA